VLDPFLAAPLLLCERIGGNANRNASLDLCGTERAALFERSSDRFDGRPVLPHDGFGFGLTAAQECSKTTVGGRAM
jgi:hypothetical protein